MMNEYIRIIIPLFIAFMPFIAYIDYHIFKEKLICSNCGKKELNKNAFLLACVLEGFMFILGCLLGILFTS